MKVCHVQHRAWLMRRRWVPLRLKRKLFRVQHGSRPGPDVAIEMVIPRPTRCLVCGTATDVGRMTCRQCPVPIMQPESTWSPWRKQRAAQREQQALTEKRIRELGIDPSQVQTG